MYPWIVFLHIVGVFGFLLSHGASVAVLFRLRKERDRQTIQALLELSSASMIGFYASIAVLLVAGIAAGFVGNWWRMLWLWLPLCLFLAISVSMYVMASRFFRRIRTAVATRPSGAPMASNEELDELLGSGRLPAVALIGYGGIVVILWLMVFKPF
jgi:uncharacterized membrane protein